MKSTTTCYDVIITHPRESLCARDGVGYYTTLVEAQAACGRLNEGERRNGNGGELEVVEVEVGAELISDEKNPYDDPPGIGAREYGTVKTGDGRLIDLCQQVYIQGDGSGCWYEAYATDRSNGGEYKVRWEITNAEAEDESDACDWDEFTLIKF